MGRITIRPAQPDEAALLTELALRSKAIWGYDAEFMESARHVLAVTPEKIAGSPFYVLDDGERIAGFYDLRDLGGGLVELDLLFIEPDAIGRGYGRKLWAHALRTARELGYREMEIESDPNAEPFYLAMGAVRAGQRESTLRPGRFLPLLRIDLQ